MGCFPPNLLVSGDIFASKALSCSVNNGQAVVFGRMLLFCVLLYNQSNRSLYAPAIMRTHTAGAELNGTGCRA